MSIKNKLWLCITAAITLASLLSIPAKADDWQHQVGMTAFAFGMEGNAGVKGIEAQMDYSIKDVLEDLDAALTLLVQGTNNSWGYWASYEYVKYERQHHISHSREISANAKINGKAIFGTEIIDAGLVLERSGCAVAGTHRRRARLDCGRAIPRRAQL